MIGIFELHFHTNFPNCKSFATQETPADLLRSQRPGVHNDLFKLEAAI